MTVDVSQKTILVVDDVPENIDVLDGVLHDRYKIKAAVNGQRALKIAMSDNPPDLILLDIMMPEMDGYEVCRRLKDDEKTRGIPVIFVTAMNEVEDERKGLELGAVDYITKPYSPAIVCARVKTHLILKDTLDNLEHLVYLRTLQLQKTKDATVLALASLAETRDMETGNHIRRTQHYVRVLAERLQENPRYQNELTDEMVELFYKTAPLHDLGKVGIPDEVLLKPGRLTPEEFEVMKGHAALGRQSLLEAAEMMDGDSSFFDVAGDIAANHHEKWDGSGYPNGLKGEKIPLAGRLMAVADVYDALISKRVYKAAMSHEEARAIILEGSGSHFCPDVVDVFRDLEDRFLQIAAEYKDED
ncbi:MAG: two-component system response regulator [Candidatus Sedimenticola sp. PURPLELP]